MNKDWIETLNFSKNNGLITAVVQDVFSKMVLMVGFQNREAVVKSLETSKVTFFSRTKQRLWTKGEKSKNFLHIKSVKIDCDEDTLLYKVEPPKETCHLGRFSCFGEKEKSSCFFDYLTKILEQRIKVQSKDSYTVKLFNSKLSRIAQKVGEEGIETVIASMENDDEAFLGECADLVFHLMVLLKKKEYTLSEVSDILYKRHQKNGKTYR